MHDPKLAAMLQRNLAQQRPVTVTNEININTKSDASPFDIGQAAVEALKDLHRNDFNIGNERDGLWDQ